MRKVIIILLVIAVAIGVAAIYLVVTTPKTAEQVRVPLDAPHRALLGVVPDAAESFALIPSAALLHDELLANPVTRDAVTRWTEEQEVPRSWMLGGGDIVAWKQGKTTAYAVRLDFFRALLVRGWMLATSNADVRWEGSTLVIHDPVPSPRRVQLEPLLQLAKGLPAADVLVVQRESARGAFPPIGRPAVTAVRVSATEVDIVAHAASADARPQREIRARFPQGALLSAAFATAPRILSDLNRLTGIRVDALVDEGGALALYGIETGTLLPRPRGVISFPADANARRQLAEIRQFAEMIGETRDAGDQLLVSFDGTSMGLYIKDAFVPGTWPANQWALRLDPARIVPVLRKAGDSAGLRIAAPRISRAARDLRRWIDALEQARSVEAADSIRGGVEELRVRVASK